MSYQDISAAPDAQDLKNLVIAGLITGILFASYFNAINSLTGIKIILLGFIVVLTREIGVRTVVNLMDGYVDLKISKEASTVSLLTGIVPILTSVPFILIFPFHSNAEKKKFEHWGRSVDVIWARYEFWISAVAIWALLIGYTTSLILGFDTLAHIYALFTFFQLLPLDTEEFDIGPLDGANIIRWSGYNWVLMMGLTMIALGITTL